MRRVLLRIRDALAPRTLHAQITLLGSGVIAVSILVVTAYSANGTVDATRAHLERQAEAAARTASITAEEHLRAKRPRVLRQEFEELLRLPGVEDLRLYAPDGRVLAVAMRAGRDAADADHAPNRPVAGGGSLGIEETAHGPELVAWEPVGSGGELGHVRAAMSLPAQSRTVLSGMRDSIIQVALLVAAMSIAFHLILRRALHPLTLASRFARGLDRDPGAHFETAGHAVEMQDLGRALNDLSARLALDRLALEVQAARTEGILDTAPDAILGIDAGGLIVFANAAVSRIFGHDPASIRGHALAELVPGFDTARIRATLAGGILMGGSDRRTATVETAGLRNGGTGFEIEVFLGEIECAADLHCTCVIRDITERRQIEEWTRLANRALDCSGNGIVISDMRLAGEPLVYANPYFETITGYAPGEAIGRNLAFLQGDEANSPDTAGARRRLRSAIEAGRSASVEIRNFRKDGSPFWNELTIAPVKDARGDTTHYVGVLTDITERIVTEQALAERGSRLDAIFSLSPDGFAVFDARERLAYVNPAFLDMAGVPVEFFDRAPTLAEFDAALRERCDPAQPYESLEAAQARELAGDTRRATPIRLRNPSRILERHVRGTTGGGTTIIYFRDVTHETEVDRMKSEFLSTAAHELRTPMASIFGFSELLLRRPYDEGKRRDMLETVHRQAGLLVNLLNELLDLSRIEARAGKDFRIRVQPLAPILADTVAALLVPDDPRKVAVSLPEPQLAVRVDSDKLRQAVTNLLSNAYKYSPGGGDITIGTVRGEHEGAPAVGIRVADRGLGMTPEQAARAFERFYRADASGSIPGTGLGLCLVKEIVEIQGGRVDLATEAGRGTQVTLWLPLPEQDLARAA